jgi:hypothetical protein
MYGYREAVFMVDVRWREGRRSERGDSAQPTAFSALKTLPEAEYPFTYLTRHHGELEDLKTLLIRFAILEFISRSQTYMKDVQNPLLKKHGLVLGGSLRALIFCWFWAKVLQAFAS